MRNSLIALLMLTVCIAKAQEPVCATPGSDGVQATPAPQNSFFPGMGDNITVNAGATSFDLDPIPPPFVVGGVLYDFGNNQISKGDLLLIIQIQGASINFTESAAYGSGNAANNGSGYLSLANVGRYEYMVALNDVTSAGGTLNFKASGTNGGLLYSYENKPADASNGVKRFQVIRLMQYSDLTLTSDIVTTPWNGKAGGLIAIDVAGTLDFNGRTINASMTGFRGGYLPSRTIQNQQYTVYRTNTYDNNNAGSTKGEGVAGTPRYVWDGYEFKDQGAGWVGYPGGDLNRGAPGNAGGGGNVHNAGGGGGGNGGPGGAGGYGWPLANESPQTNNRNSQLSLQTGGRPGAAMPSNVSNGLLFMGGGGGAGDANNSSNGARGGVGGGLVLITANKVKGTGYILANGGKGEPGDVDGSGDGAGGGGAGGSVYISVKEPSTGSIFIQAKGGNGGHSTTTDLHGPGGGGGGGIIYYNANGVTVTTDVSPGEAGRINAGEPVNPANYANFPEGANKLQNGTTPGQPGVVSSFSIEELPPYLMTSAFCYPELTIRKWRDNPLDSIPAGSMITYKIQIYNSGGGAKGVRLHDDLPAGFQFVSATIDYGVSPGNPQPLNNIGTPGYPILGTFNLVTGEEAYVEMNVQVPFNTPVGTYHNGIQIGYLDPTREISGPERVIFPPTHALPGQNTDYIEGEADIYGSNYHSSQEGEEVVVMKPELGIIKTINSQCVDPVNGNTYSIVLLNPNSFELYNIPVTDIIDSELVVTSVSGTGWTYSNSGNNYTLTLATLAQGTPEAPFASAPVYITVQPIGSPTKTNWLNTATVPTPKGVASSSVILYRQPTQATASDITPVNTCTDGVYYLSGNAPSVGVGKWEFVGPSGNAYFENENQSNTRILGLQPEQTVSVVWTITNSSCGTVSSPPLNFTRPATPTATISGGGTLCAGAPITSAQNITITLTPAAGRKRIKYIDGSGAERVVVTDAGATSYTFTPAYAGTHTLLEIKAGGTDANPNHTSWGPTNCPGITNGVAQVNIITQGPVGGSISYQGGPVCRGGVVPTPLVLSGHSGAIVRWESSTNAIDWTPIPAAANLTSYSPTISVGTYFRAIVERNEGGCFPGGTTSTIVYVPVTDCNDLTIEKTIDDLTPDAEQEVIFTIKAKNLTLQPANGVMVYDKLPNGYTWISHNAPAGTTYNEATGLWDIGTLNAEQELILTITVKVNPTGQYTNKAVISCTEQETNYANNTAILTPDVNCDVRNVSPKVTK